MQTNHFSILIIRRILSQPCMLLLVCIALFTSCSTSSRLSSTTSGNNYEPSLLAQSQLTIDTPTLPIAIYSSDSFSLSGDLEHNSTTATQTAHAKPKASSTLKPARPRTAEAPPASIISENSVDNQLYSALSPWLFRDNKGSSTIRLQVVCSKIFWAFLALIFAISLAYFGVYLLEVVTVWDSEIIIWFIVIVLAFLFLLFASYNLIRKLLQVISDTEVVW